MNYQHTYEGKPFGYIGELEDSGERTKHVFECYVQESKNASMRNNDTGTSPENNCNISSNIHDPLAFENYFNRNTVVGSNVNVEESNHTYDNPWATEEPFLTSENFLATWVPMPESDGQISKMTEQSRQNAIDQEPLAADLAPQDDDSDAAIGTALKNGKFKCILKRCARKTFKRQAELRRHYKTIHAAQKPEFWCNVLSCDRSVAAGGRPFHRKDKLQDHVQRMHERGNDMVQE